MDCNRVCHCKSVEFIRSVGKIIFNRPKYTKSRLVHSIYFKRLICLFPCRTYFRYVYWRNHPSHGVIPCDHASNGEGKPLNWEYLISEEGKKMMLLYRIANMFVDVPALKESST